MSFLDPILGPLLNMNLLLAILIVSFVITLVMTLIYKLMTDQKLMKELRDEIKSFQKQMKELRHDPAKVMEIQKKAMEKNMKYMTHSMKPTLITLLPIIVIFGWLNANLTYDPILANQDFTTTLTFEESIAGTAELISPDGITILSDNEVTIANSIAQWRLKADEGDYIIKYKYGDKIYQKEFKTGKGYYPPLVKVKDKTLKFISVDHNKVKPLASTGIPWIKNWGWLGTYILFSVIFSMTIRKLLKIH